MAPGTELGGVLQRFRHACGFTQEELAERAGVSTRAVSDLERGVHPRARRHTLERLAEALELEPSQRDELFARSAGNGPGIPPLPLPAPLRPVADDPFFGRTDTRVELGTSWRRAADGQTQVVVLAGDPGIGKSALARVTAQGLHADGATVLFGRCEEDASDPYRPFLEAFRTLAASLPAERMRSLAGPGEALLSPLIPTLASTPDTRERRPADQLGMLEAIRSLLEGLARANPSVLLLEDLHWAGRETIALLRHIARLGAGRLLVIGTARLGEEAGDRRFEASVVELRRQSKLRVVSLDGLEPVDIGAILGAWAGVSPPELADALHRETGGNPFFVRDLVGQLVSADAVRDGRWRRHFQDGLQPGDDVRFVVGRQVERVPMPTRHLLTIAAAIGPTFDLATLAVVAELEPREVLAAMDEAVAARLVTEVGAYGCWEFTHGIVRSSLYQSITRTTRARLHARIAESIEASEVQDPDDIERLAMHYHRALAVAGVANRAARYSQLSAERAAAVLAWEDAAAGFEQAVEALDYEPGADQLWRCDLLVALGRARTEALQRHLARPVFLDAARRAMEIAAPDRLAPAAYGYAYMTKQGSPGDDAVETWQRALAAIGPDDRAARATVLCALSTAHRLRGEASAMRDTSSNALDEARAAGDTAGLKVALATRSAALWDSPELAPRITLAEELVGLGRATSDVDAELDGLALLGLPLLAAGRVAEFDDAVATVRRVAQAHHRRISVAQTLQWAAMRSLMRGQFEAARKAADEALDVSGAPPNFTAGHLALHYAAQRLEAPERPVDPQLEVLADQEAGLTVWRAAVAAAHCNRGDRQSARRLLRGYVPADVVELGWSRVVTLALLAEVVAALGDVEAATQLAELLTPYEGTLVVVASGTSCEGAVDHYLGLLAAARGDLSGAAQRLDAAEVLEQAADAPALAARTKRDRERLLDGRRATSRR